MFSFFGKKEKKDPIIKDLIFISATAKQKAVKKFLTDHPDTLLLTWFEESYDEARHAFPGMEGRICLTRELSSPQLQQSSFIFFEHYPLLLKEKEWLENNNSGQAVFYSSLDEPLFLYAGGENIAILVKKLGMQEDEAISHPMISKSIDNARKKLAEKVVTEFNAFSQKEWFQKNLTDQIWKS